jgi:hypothetical protein
MNKFSKLAKISFIISGLALVCTPFAMGLFTDNANETWKLQSVTAHIIWIGIVAGFVFWFLSKLFPPRPTTRCFCPVSEILAEIKDTVDIDAPILRLEISYRNQTHKVGVTSDYDGKKFFDIVYFLDENEWKTFDEFLNYACIDSDIE